MSKSIEAVIDEVIIDPNRIQPIIVNFQNGALKDKETSRMECGVYEDTKEGKTVLAMSNGQIVYKGYRPDPDKEELTYTMLAIHNKKTGKIRLIQAERWEVAPILDRQVDVNNELSMAEKIGALNKQFGSKKTKRRTEQYERLQVNIESSKEQLEKSISNVEIDRADLSTKTMTEDSSLDDHLPVCNRDATDVRDAYNIYDIVPKDVLKSLDEKIDEILEESHEKKSQFYKKMLERLKSDPKRNKKVPMLEYIETVRTWFSVPFRDVKKKSIEIYPWSPQMNNFVVEKYSMQGANGRLRPTSMKDKGIIDCMILALFISNFTLDMELFMTVFSASRISVKKFADFAKLIGAVPTKENKKIYVLKVPLPPPISTLRKVMKAR